MQKMYLSNIDIRGCRVLVFNAIFNNISVIS